MQVNREAAGRYLFRQRPVIVTGPMSGLETMLLEWHEHSHWELANVSIFGLEQQVLAETIHRTDNKALAELLKTSLDEMISASFLCYETAALAQELVGIAFAKAEPSDEWFSFPDDPRYAEALSLARELRETLGCSPDFAAILLQNLAELCLNSSGPILFDMATGQLNGPANFDGAQFRHRLAAARPDEVFQHCLQCLNGRTGWIGTMATALEPLFQQFGVSSDPMRSEILFPATDKIFSGRLAFEVYEWLRLALCNEVQRLHNWPLQAVDKIRSDIWHSWMAALGGDAPASALTRPAVDRVTSAMPFFGNTPEMPDTEEEAAAYADRHHRFSKPANAVELYPVRKTLVLAADNWFEFGTAFQRIAAPVQFTLVGVDPEVPIDIAPPGWLAVNLTRVTSGGPGRTAALRVSPVTYARLVEPHCLLGLLEELRRYRPVFYASPAGIVGLYERLSFRKFKKLDDIVLVRLDLQHEDHWRRTAVGLAKGGMVSACLHMEPETNAAFIVMMGSSLAHEYFVSPLSVSHAVSILELVEKDPVLAERANYFDGVHRLPIENADCLAIRSYCRKLAIYGV